jgi:hypothetical protein
MARLTVINAKIGRVFESAGIAYASILMYQLWRIGAIWFYRDLTVGDTASYFGGAVEWQVHGTVNFAWSPLYTAFYGSMLALTGDAYLATILHRLLIACSATVVILALARRIFNPTLAWFAAAWWASLAINFNTAYEIHLFSILPALMALLFLVALPSKAGRPIALACLLAGAALQRNEYSVPLIVFAVYLAVVEIKLLRNPTQGRSPWRKSVVRYACALGLIGLLMVMFYSRSRYKLPELWSIFHGKHIANVCQVYAVSYQQRHPEYIDSPWTDCERLMMRTFGKPLPSVTEALWANPKAMLEHFWWHVLLVPAGIEVLLFDATGFKVNPDFVAVQHSPRAHILLGALIVFWLGGIWAIKRSWGSYWRGWFTERRDLTVLVGGLVLMSVMALLVERPRPSYLFSLEACLLLTTLACASALMRESGGLDGLTRYGWIAAVGLFFVVTPFYGASNRRPRPVYDGYQRLSIHPESFDSKRPTVLLSSVFPFELCSYAVRKDPGGCTPLYYPDLRRLAEPGSTPRQLLDRSGASIVYLDEAALSDEYFRDVLQTPESYGWLYIGAGTRRGDRWALLTKGDASSAFPHPACPPPAPMKLPVRIDAGMPTNVSNQRMGPWLLDIGYAGGAVYSTTATVTATSQPMVYQTNRWGPRFTYSFVVPNGRRVVTLKFAEIAPVKPGERSFDVLVNGLPLLRDFDVVAAAGGMNIAVDRSFDVNVTDQLLKIEFVTKKANAFLSGIEIK